VSSAFRIESDTLTPGLAGLPKFLDDTVGNTMRFYAPQVESAAKTNAPWQDRTGNARSGLIARAESSGDSYAIILAHQVPYGIWLEVRWAGRYAIIMPTIQAYGPKVMSTLRNVLERYSA
jgi:hypothetical protein